MNASFKERHAAAMLQPATTEEKIVAELFTALTQMADLYKGDTVMKPAVMSVGFALLRMMDADLGRIDPGLLQKQVTDVVRRAGWDTDEG